MEHISHPNIVEFYDHFADDKYIYLVLELLSGG
jgi:serine/threonine protein kinase